MSEETVRYGEWPSPITADVVVAAAVSLGEVVVADDRIHWNELRPDEAGRVQVVRRTADGRNVDLLPSGCSARTRVHEYGGAAWTVAKGRLVFNNWDDQRLYQLTISDDGGAGDPEPISPEPTERHGFRHADLRIVGSRVVCVRERHDTGGEAANEVVSVALDGSADVVTLVSGPDFVSNPRVSPDGTALAWLEWDHPDMPWDHTRVCVARLGDDGRSLGPPAVVAGEPGESVIMPTWSPDGTLHVVSDRTDWWNLYALEEGELVPVAPMEAEVGTPPWVFGMSRYGFLADGRVVLAFAADGVDHLGVVADGEVVELDLPYTEIASVTTDADATVFVGAGFDREPAVVRVPVDDPVPSILRPPRALSVERSWFSIARPVSFRSGDRTAHALYYAPTNPDVRPPEGELPPLLVLIHGGPTAMARGRLDLAKQFWTSRGFAVVDVNYGGSTGFGRAYRELLRGRWGIVDVQDCIAAAQHLAAEGLADPARLCIRGGSAGGFTVLAALTESDVFAAGASSYGVADLTALAEETHKFESRYLDGLVGPYPDARGIYEERSPINHVDRLDSPLIVFQGLEDEIVPPNQSEMIVEALRDRGVPVAYLAFEGEQHGFRRSETVVRVLQSELAFYGRVLGFTPHGDLPAVEVDNLS